MKGLIFAAVVAVVLSLVATSPAEAHGFRFRQGFRAGVRAQQRAHFVAPIVVAPHYGVPAQGFIVPSHSGSFLLIR